MSLFSFGIKTQNQIIHYYVITKNEKTMLKWTKFHRKLSVPLIYATSVYQYGKSTSEAEYEIYIYSK